MLLITQNMVNIIKLENIPKSLSLQSFKATVNNLITGKYISNSRFLEQIPTEDFGNNINLNFQPETLINAVFEQKNKILKAQSDYISTSNIITESRLNQINLVIPFLESTKNWLFPYLNTVLRQLQKTSVEKIILHFISDVEVLNLWNDFSSKYHQTLENLAGKIFLGSLSDKKYAMANSSNLEQMALAVRVIINPKVAAFNQTAETIDEYLKLHYNARYYENYDTYTEADLANFESENDIVIQLQKILAHSSNADIFPVDIRTNSALKTDIIWYLDGDEVQLESMLDLQTNLNTQFDLKQTIITNFSNLNPTNLLSNPNRNSLSISSNKTYHPVFNLHFGQSLNLEFINNTESIQPEKDLELALNSSLLNSKNLSILVSGFINSNQFETILTNFITANNNFILIANDDFILKLANNSSLEQVLDSQLPRLQTKLNQAQIDNINAQVIGLTIPNSLTIYQSFLELFV